jgi:hypothetical protein
LGALLTGGIIFLGILLYQEGKFVGEGAIALATGGLALFTGFLWLSAAITARFARSEISTSTAVNSANLTLQLDNRFNSDRGLRIRHGAVTFLAKEKILNLPCHCNISPYSTDDDNLWYDLTPDLSMSRKLWVRFLCYLEGVHREVALQRPLLAAPQGYLRSQRACTHLAGEHPYHPRPPLHLPKEPL